VDMAGIWPGLVVKFCCTIDHCGDGVKYCAYFKENWCMIDNFRDEF